METYTASCAVPVSFYFVARTLKEGKTMFYHLFRITLLGILVAIILAACGAPATEQSIVTLAPATEVVPTATEIAPTTTSELTATQVMLGVVEGAIAFQSDRDGDKEIYVMNGDGSGLINLTDNLADDAPFWSPDGTQITFSSERDGNAEIYAMNADGSGQMRLTDNPADDEISIWQP